MFYKLTCAATIVFSTILTFVSAAEQDWSEGIAWFLVAFTTALDLIAELEK